MQRLFIIAAAALMSACAGGAAEPEYSAMRSGEAQTAADRAYQQCLKDSQAIAMAWEAIEDMCRERSGAKDPRGLDEK